MLDISIINQTLSQMKRVNLLHYVQMVVSITLTIVIFYLCVQQNKLETEQNKLIESVRIHYDCIISIHDNQEIVLDTLSKAGYVKYNPSEIGKR